MDTRIGYPSEHLAGDTQKSETSPILATAVGLLMNALEQQEKNDFESIPSKENEAVEDKKDEDSSQAVDPNPMSSSRKTILDRWVEKFKEFLDNA
jgi:cell division protein FtsA